MAVPAPGFSGGKEGQTPAAEQQGLSMEMFALRLFIPVRVADKIGGDTRSVLVKFRTLA